MRFHGGDKSGGGGIRGKKAKFVERKNPVSPVFRALVEGWAFFFLYAPPLKCTTADLFLN